MLKIKLTISVILLFLILPGCLARYGEERLNQLLLSIKDLEENGEELTEEKIKGKLGKPGFLKPIYETTLDLTSCKTHKTLLSLKKDSGVLLTHHPDNLYDMLLGKKQEELKSLKLLSYVYDRMGRLEEMSLTFYVGSIEGTAGKEPFIFGWDYVEYGD